MVAIQLVAGLILSVPNEISDGKDHNYQSTQLGNMDDNSGDFIKIGGIPMGSPNYPVKESHKNAEGTC